VSKVKTTAGNTVNAHTGLPPTSPYEIEFGQDGSVFDVVIRFDEGTRLLISVHLQRDNAAKGRGLLINDVEVGSVNHGGGLLLSASKLAGFGLETFEDIHTVGLTE
jgi:hypothetical protein